MDTTLVPVMRVLENGFDGFFDKGFCHYEDAVKRQ
jgi:hypothetical protein